MPILRPDVTVSSLAALTQLHVSELLDGSSAWVSSLERYYTLLKSSGLTPNGTTIVAPIAGSPIAGNAGAVWVDSGNGGSPLFNALAAPFSITTAPPTAPFAYNPGQPAVVVALGPVALRGGQIEARAEFCGFLSNDGTSILEENQAWADFAIFLDGVRVTRAYQEFFFEQDPTAFGGPGKTVGVEGSLTFIGTVTEGNHTIDLRAGCSGAGPRATVVIDPTSVPAGPTMPTYYAQIIVRET